MSIWDRIWERIDLHETQKVLFVGFGDGEEIAEFGQKLQRTSTIYGIEINSRLIETAQQRHATLPQKLVLQIAKAKSLPFESESFDLVFSKAVLSEIPDWNELLQRSLGSLYLTGELLS